MCNATQTRWTDKDKGEDTDLKNTQGQVKKRQVRLIRSSKSGQELREEVKSKMDTGEDHKANKKQTWSKLETPNRLNWKQ